MAARIAEGRMPIRMAINITTVITAKMIIVFMLSTFKYYTSLYGLEAFVNPEHLIALLSIST